MYLLKLLPISLVILFTQSLAATELKPCMEIKCTELFKEFKIQAKRRHSSAYSALGEFYQVGYGTEKNIKLALKNFKKAGKFGNVHANFKAASIYMTEKDYYNPELAVKYFKKAARDGHSFAGTLASMLYIGSDLGEPDYSEADKWLSKALVQNNPMAVYVAKGLKDQNKLTHLPKSLSLYDSALKNQHEIALRNSNRSANKPTTTSPSEFPSENSIEIIEVQAPEVEEILSDELTVLASTRGDMTNFDSIGGRVGKKCGEIVSCWSVDLEDFKRYYNYHILGE